MDEKSRDEKAKLNSGRKADVATKTTLRPIALLEILLKLIDSIAVDQIADHIFALRVQDGAEAMIGAVRRQQSADAKRHIQYLRLN